MSKGGSEDGGEGRESLTSQLTHSVDSVAQGRVSLLRATLAFTRQLNTRLALALDNARVHPSIAQPAHTPSPANGHQRRDTSTDRHAQHSIRTFPPTAAPHTAQLGPCRTCRIDWSVRLQEPRGPAPSGSSISHLGPTRLVLSARRSKPRVAHNRFGATTEGSNVSRAVLHFLRPVPGA